MALHIVPPEGSRSATIALVGTSPGFREAQLLRPFVGPSWWLLEKQVLPHCILPSAQRPLSRGDFYITNVDKRTWGNTDAALPRCAQPGGRDWPGLVDALHAELFALPNLRVVVAFGNFALAALTGHTGIMRWRGSRLAVALGNARKTITCIPAIHPAAVIRTPVWLGRLVHDMQTAAEESEAPGLILPQRRIAIAPTLADVAQFIAALNEPSARTLALDIETTIEPAPSVLCCGFALSAHRAFVLPLTRKYWKSARKHARAWDALKTICAHPIAKVMHHGLFDTYWLAMRNIAVRNWRYDTLAMHHALDPAQQGDSTTSTSRWRDSTHSLAFVASMFTREPFWKDKVRWADRTPEEALWLYCGTDAAVTRELANTLRRALKAIGLWHFYRRTYPRQLHELLRLALTGLHVDAHEMARIAADNDLAMHACRGQLGGLIARCGISTKKLASQLYGMDASNLHLPIQRSKHSKGPSTDEASLRRLATRFPSAHPLIANVLTYRKAMKAQEVVRPNMDADGRLRGSFSPYTETGRLRSSKTPEDTGRNLQNLDHELRRVVLPEPGHVLLEADLSQVEDRIVRILTSAPRQIEMARALPNELDQHKRTAARIFTKPESAISPAERDMGKRTNHAVQRGMRGRTMSAYLAKDDIFIPERECQRRIDCVLDMDSELLDYMRETRLEVAEFRCLTNSWGRVWRVPYDRLDDDLYRRAYAWRPQSEPPEIIMRRAQLPLRKTPWVAARKAVILNNVHDSLLVSVEPSIAYDVAAWLLAHIEHKCYLRGAWWVPYATIKLGANWGKMAEWKRLPSRAEMLQTAQELNHEL